MISVGILNLFGESTLELILKDWTSLEEAECSLESKAKPTVLCWRQQGRQRAVQFAGGDRSSNEPETGGNLKSQTIV
jgi:hypothetical protein